MRKFLLFGLVTAVMLGFSVQVMADDDDDDDDRHGHGHGWHDRDDDDDDEETWIFLGDPGFHGGNWGPTASNCRVERRWENDGDYEERIDCRGPSHSSGWNSVPVLRAPSLNIVIPIN